MIIINLLPQEQRKIERKIVIPNLSYVFLGLGVLVLVHFLFFSVFLMKKAQVGALSKTSFRVAPQSKDASLARDEMKKLETKVSERQKEMTRSVSLTELLSDLNIAVPRGMWLERFSFANTGFVIQGSVVSLAQSEMTIIGKFLQELKDNKSFSAPFSKIELTSVQRRTIRTYDVVDFVLTGEMKK